MKKIYFLLFTLIASVSYGQVINEIDADQTGTDAGEFIELKWTPNTSLDGLVVVLFNGSDNLSYNDAFDLDGQSTDANGFYILGNTGIISAGDTDMGADNALQNGADAVALYQANGTDFLNDTAITLTGLVDVIVYGTSDNDDMELLTGFGVAVQYDENLNTLKDVESLQRTDDGSTYETKAPTFRQENSAATCDLNFTGTSVVCDAFTTGTDTYTATVTFTGGGTSSYTVIADSGIIDLTMGDPSTDATGTIMITGVTEAVNLVVTAQDGGLCDLMSTIVGPTCVPSLDLPFYEAFDYTAGANLIDDVKWENVSSSSDEVLVAAGNLAYTGLADSMGNHVTFDGTGSDPAIQFTPVTAGELFTSFIFTVTDQTAITDLADGGYFAVLGSFDARLWVRPEVDAASTTFVIGGGIASSNPMLAAGTFNVGDPVFVVLSYNIDTATANVWVNPTPAELASGTPPTVSITEVDTSPATTIGQFVLRQDTAGETPFMQFDELRIGTSWADVTPTSLSVEDFQANLFNVYPNPATNGFVNISSKTNEAISVQVFDILGKQVINQTVSNNVLNIASLTSGVYILKVLQNGNVTTKKLVIK